MLKIEHVRKTYDSFSLDCTMEVVPGRVTGLIGQNGAGKSTTFKAVLGLISLDGGSVRMFGKGREDITVSDKEQLGVVLSDSGFSGYLTVRDLFPVLACLYKNFNRDQFAEQIRRFGLPTNKKIKEFSTGMKAKLKLLAALSHGAKLLILDEPTAGLDVIARDEILDLLRGFMEEDESRSILISSHISSDLETLCDDFYMIHNGSVLMHEETDVLLSDYALIKVDESQFARMDKRYLLRCKRESYGYCCLTNQKQYYMDNYPLAAIEKGAMDETMMMMIRGDVL